MTEKTKILVVDDDPLIVKATRRLLEKAGYQTLPAHTGQEALEAARAHHPDLILLDVNMPDMNGFDACRQLKADPDLADIGVIIVTSTYTDGESQAAGLDLGADGYIARPVSNRELLARIQALLRTRAAEQQAQRIAAEWQATFDAVNSAIFLTDAEYNIVRHNLAAEAMFGKTAQQILGQKCYCLVHESQQPYYACPLMTVKKDKTRQTMVFERNGRWLEVSVDPVLDEGGKFIGAVHVVNDITERKQAEQALRESEERFRMLADTTSTAIFVYQGERFVYANRATAEISGYSQDEFLQMRFWDIVHPEHREMVKQRGLARQRGEALPNRYEFKIIAKSGQERWLDFTAGKITWMGQEAALGTAFDITERRQTEQALRESEASLRRQNALVFALLENLRIGVFMVEAPSGKPLIANEAAKQLLGQGILPDASEKNLAEVYRARKQGSSEPYPTDEMPIVRGMYGEAAHVDDMIVTRPDGSEILLEVFGTPIRDESGKVWASLVSFYDITERKRAEEALRESEERHRAISEFISDYAYSFRVEEENRLVREWVTAESFTRLTGYTPQEMDERGGWASIIYPEDMPIAQARARRLFAGQHDVSEFRIVRKDGSIRWLRDHGHPIVDETQGRVIRIYGAAQDITERKQREDEIRRLNAELEARVEERTRQLKEAQEQLVRQEKLAVLGQLAGGVGHELRNPLAVISNAVYFLKLVLPEADEKVQEYLNLLERETRSAEKIISDLLDFARLKSAERQAVSAAELARRVFERYPAPENIRLVLDLPADLPPLWVDARQIEQVLGNLVLNAYQAMTEGGQLSVISHQSPVISHQSSVTDESLMSEHCLLITVKDTGPGIPPENLPRLFEPLFTTKPHGIGLGLAVSQKLVEANGGRIEVESEPGKGAAFTLILPAVKEGT